MSNTYQQKLKKYCLLKKILIHKPPKAIFIEEMALNGGRAL